MLLRARTLLPVSSAPVEDGGVLVSRNRIVAAGPWRELAAHAGQTAVDLGAVILMPGLINGHCHLDYTDMIGLPPQKQFPDWIKGLLALKAAASYSEYAASWLRGASMLAGTGTTTVADIEAVPELLPEVWSSTPLRVVSFLEMTGVGSRREPGEILSESAARIQGLPPARGGAGLSPHALYSTVPLLLSQTAKVAGERHWRVTTHLAESLAEYEMYVDRRGSLFDWLKNQRDMSDCGHGTPVEQARRCGLLGGNFLAIHANYLGPCDAAALAESGSSVVHCPRSHAYFQHAPFPYARLAAAGVNVCLGTDSLASVIPEGGAGVKLNMFAELDAFAACHPAVRPETIVRMATEGGARALGWQERVGGIFEDGLADLIAIPFNGKTEEAWEAVVHHGGEVAASMIDGQWLSPNPPARGAHGARVCAQ